MGSEQTILVVEEDATCRAFLADNLAEDGYQVASAETRDQALALLASRRAHLVLADLNGQTLGLLDAEHPLPVICGEPEVREFFHWLESLPNTERVSIGCERQAPPQGDPQAYADAPGPVPGDR